MVIYIETTDDFLNKDLVKDMLNKSIKDEDIIVLNRETFIDNYIEGYCCGRGLDCIINSRVPNVNYPDRLSYSTQGIDKSILCTNDLDSNRVQTFLNKMNNTTIPVQLIVGDIA